MSNSKNISFDEIKDKLSRLGYELDAEGYLLEDKSKVSFLNNKEFVSVKNLDTLNMFLNSRHRLNINDEF